MKLVVAHAGSNHELDLPPEATLSQLREAIAEATSVPPANQKLLPKPARGINLAKADARATLQQTGFRDGITIMVLGATAEQVTRAQEEEQEASKWKQPRNYHPSMLKGTKPRSTATVMTTSPFGSIAPHTSLPPSDPLFDRIQAYLERLATDEGVLHVCRLHNFRVGHLTELLPWEATSHNSKLLGLNEGAGQTIRLRVRTDNGVGLRDYKETRTVLLHELAHNEVADHPPEFKILNSKLNAELAAFEKNRSEGTHSLVQGDMYVPPEPSASSTLGGGSYRLGGSSIGGGGLTASANSSESRRNAVLEATLKRMQKLEAEIELGCGSSATTDSSSSSVTQQAGGQQHTGPPSSRHE